MTCRPSLDIHEESGQTMVEYAVVLGVITLAIVTTLGALSGTIGTAITAIVSRV